MTGKMHSSEMVSIQSYRERGLHALGVARSPVLSHLVCSSRFFCVVSLPEVII